MVVFNDCRDMASHVSLAQIANTIDDPCFDKQTWHAMSLRLLEVQRYNYINL